MNNTFDFSYFIPTPDTTANCALSRWNNGLMGLSDFLKSYMSSRQSLEFGFSRNLNVKELLNLSKNNVYNDEEKYDYVINYRKFGDIKANVCGFEIPVVDFDHPFFVQEIQRNAITNEIIDFSSPYKNGISHVYNCNSTLSKSERINATKDALEGFKVVIQDQFIISDDQLNLIFKKDNGNYRSRQQIVSELETAINTIDNLDSDAVEFIFGFDNREDLESIQDSFPVSDTILYNNSSYDFYRDLCCNSFCTISGSIDTFLLNISEGYKQEFQDKYLTPFGIKFSYVENLRYRNSANEKSHFLLFFKFDIIEKPTIAPFISHDGTIIPTTEQRFRIQYSLQDSKDRGTETIIKSYWDDNEECPVYFDSENNSHPMSLESNIDGMGGRDYTFWSSPVQKTENGYQFECCIPLAFYNSESDTYNNEYYAMRTHDEIALGEVMYRVPVVKRMRQNIEEAIVNTHLTKCLNDLVPATNENAEDDDTIVLGGVVVDDFTGGLYTVADNKKIASDSEYGEIKIIKATDDVLELMYNYSNTGELSYNGMTMPESGRAVDMIALFDTLNKLGISKSELYYGLHVYQNEPSEIHYKSMFNTDVLPFYNWTYSLGNENYRWENIYGNNINCLTFRPGYPRAYRENNDNNINVPVGSTLLVTLKIQQTSSYDTLGNYEIFTGDRFDVSIPESPTETFTENGEFGFYNYHDSSEYETPSRVSETYIRASLSTNDIDINTSSGDFSFGSDTIKQYLSGKFVALSSCSSVPDIDSRTGFYLYSYKLILLVMKEDDIL